MKYHFSFQYYFEEHKWRKRCRTKLIAAYIEIYPIKLSLKVNQLVYEIEYFHL